MRSLNHESYPFLSHPLHEVYTSTRSSVGSASSQIKFCWIYVSHTWTCVSHTIHGTDIFTYIWLIFYGEATEIYRSSPGCVMDIWQFLLAPFFPAFSDDPKALLPTEDMLDWSERRSLDTERTQTESMIRSQSRTQRELNMKRTTVAL